MKYNKSYTININNLNFNQHTTTQSSLKFATIYATTATIISKNQNCLYTASALITRAFQTLVEISKMPIL